ncbi:MAG: M48 family metallopeptidase [Bacteroidota bacterium]
MSIYNAILIDPGPGFNRESGSIEVKASSILFFNENRKHDISFLNLEMTVGGNNKELVFFADKRNKDISFYTSDRSILKDSTIKAHPDFASQMKVVKKARRSITLALFIICVIIASIVVSLFAFKDTFVEGLANKVPIDWEQKMGDKLFATMSLQYDFIENDSLKTELIRIAAPLIKQIEKDGTKIEFYFIKDPTINAFALPGGKVIVQTGLIENAKSWEELLGVVGHELAHVKRRHHIRGVIDNLGLYVIISSLVGDISAISGTIINMGGDLASLSNSRDFETEADETGLDYLVAAGINPEGLISFFKTLDEQTPVKTEGYMSFLSTHPATEDRIDHLKKLLKEKNVKIELIKDDFNHYKQIIKK